MISSDLLLIDYFIIILMLKLWEDTANPLGIICFTSRSLEPELDNSVLTCFKFLVTVAECGLNISPGVTGEKALNL